MKKYEEILDAEKSADLLQIVSECAFWKRYGTLPEPSLLKKLEKKLDTGSLVSAESILLTYMAKKYKNEIIFLLKERPNAFLQPINFDDAADRR